MNTLILILSFCGVAALGAFNIFRAHRAIHKEIDLVKDFLVRLGRLFDGNELNADEYTWLIRRSPKVQSTLGHYGIAHSFSPAYSNQLYSNYPLILNGIPAIRREAVGRRITRRAEMIGEYVALIHEAIFRFIGSSEDELAKLQAQLKNPIIWLREGMSTILLLPLYVLFWLGITGNSLVNRVSGSAVFKVFAGFITLLGGVSTLMTIIVGWEQFVGALTSLFSG